MNTALFRCTSNSLLELKALHGDLIRTSADIYEREIADFREEARVRRERIEGHRVCVINKVNKTLNCGSGSAASRSADSLSSICRMRS